MSAVAAAAAFAATVALAVGASVRVGHVCDCTRAQDMAAYSASFDLALLDLPHPVDAELFTLSGCDQFTAPNASTRLVVEHGVNALVGLICSNGTRLGRARPTVALGGTPVSHFAAWVWDVAVVSSSMRAAVLSDKRVYATLARVSATLSEFGAATVQLLLHFDWRHVCVVRNSGEWAPEYFWNAAKKDLPAAGISINLDLDLADASALTDAHLQLIRSSCRVLVVFLGTKIADTNWFMLALHDAGLTTTDFAFVVPQATTLLDGDLPWQLDAANAQSLLQIYKHALVVVPVGYDAHTVDVFLDRIDPIMRLDYNVTRQEVMSDTFRHLPFFYDSIQLYMRALTACWNLTNCDWTSGRQLVRVMSSVAFEGATGHVAMTADADRMQPFQVAVLVQRALLPHLAIDIVTDAFNHTHRRTVRQIGEQKEWMTADGEPPPDIPPCGYLAELCPKTYWAEIAVISGGLLVALILAIVGWKRAKAKQLETAILAMNWLITREELRPRRLQKYSMNELSRASLHSTMAPAASHANADSLDGPDVHYAALSGGFSTTALFRGTEVALKRCVTRDHLKLAVDAAALVLLKQLKDLNNENVNGFVGICHSSKFLLTIVWNFCQKNSLEDIVYNDEIELDEAFQSSILKDILGFQRSTAEAEGDLALLHTAPEVLKATDAKERLARATAAADVYSFAVIAYEVLSRDSPFDTIGEQPQELLAALKGNSPARQVRPRVDAARRKRHPAELMALIERCWSIDVDSRPTLGRIRAVVDVCLAKYSKNIVEHMVGMMERYAKNLEQMVHSRTDQLNEERKRADNLLNRMLPPSVAEQLKRGVAVDAEMYDCASMLFSDIVGFTALCGASTPMQIVAMLNQLYSTVDALIAARDAYKVETVGDAYLVASGLPIRNGKQHAVELAVLSLQLIKALEGFRVAHVPSRPMQMRVGLHSGAVATGVVGLAMPHYCLFGDAVNVTSRMEQTSLPMRVHVSAAFRDQLDAAAPNRFVIEHRGTVQLKGKGDSDTFWLNGEIVDNW